MTTDWQDDQPHPHMALAQYTQGVPLARKPVNAGNASGTVAGSMVQTLVPLTAQDQPGFQILLFLTQAAGVPTIPFTKLNVIWQDTASGLSMTPRSFVLPVCSPSSAIYCITGPARLDQVQVTLQNIDPAIGVNYSFTYSQNSHPWEVERCLEVSFNTLPLFTRPVGNPLDGVLGSMMATVAASGHQDRLAATWAGKGMVTVDNTGGAADVIVQLIDPGVVLGVATLYGTASTGILWSERVTANGPVSLEAALPNGPVVMRVNNTSGASSVSPTVTLLYVDQ